MKYEDITKYTGTYEAYLREDTDNKFWLVNTNKLVRFYPGVDGLKTGFTQEATLLFNGDSRKGWDASHCGCFWCTYFKGTKCASNENA